MVLLLTACNTLDIMYYMTYKSTITSKGTITLPAEFRRKLNLKQGQAVDINIENNKLIINKQLSLTEIQARNSAIIKKNGIKPLNDEELDLAIDKAWGQAAIQREIRSKQ